MACLLGRCPNRRILRQVGWPERNSIQLPKVQILLAQILKLLERLPDLLVEIVGAGPDSSQAKLHGEVAGLPAVKARPVE